MSARRKRKWPLENEVVESTQPPTFQEVSPATTERVVKVLVGSAPEAKRKKPWANIEEDPDNFIVKILRGTLVFADLSKLQKFAGGLHLEGDEERLANVGIVEATRKVITYAFEVMFHDFIPKMCRLCFLLFIFALLQALECTLFLNKAVDIGQKRMRDLEKSNTSLRKSAAEVSASVQKVECRVKKHEQKLKEV